MHSNIPGVLIDCSLLSLPQSVLYRFSIIFIMCVHLFICSCDEEYARRVQMQNEWVVRQVDSMQDHKHSLLFAIASNLDAEVQGSAVCSVCLYVC